MPGPLSIFLLALLSGAALLPAAGAGGETRWSLTPLVRPVVPGTEPIPIDSFIRSKLREHRLEPSPGADRRTLLRRLSYDLTGLPPSSGEVEAFVEDKKALAYGNQLSRLLASPHYGEHWARHWLDVANYADTHGNDHDYARPNAWPYRDYVIRSFNNDKPYPRFVAEQIAGDVLFPEDPLATVALGFLAAGPWDHTLMVTVREDTVDHRSAQNLDRDSMVTAAMGTFQSLTVQCARCHDHKFDPVSQREYYALQAVFAGVDRADRPVQMDPETQKVRTRLQAEARALEALDTVLLARLDSPGVRQEVAAWEQEWARREEAWKPLEILSVVSTGGATLTRQEDGSWFVGGARPDRDTYVMTAHRPAGKLAALRLEVLPDDRLPQRGPGRWDAGNFHLSGLKALASVPGTKQGAQAIVFAKATADFNESPGISAAQAIDGNDATHWGVHPRYGQRHEAVFEVEDVVAYPEATLFTVMLEHQDGVPGHGIGRFRLSASDAPPPATTPQPLPGGLLELLSVPVEQRTAGQRRDLALAVLKWENARALAALPPPQMVYAVTRDFIPDGENFKPTAHPRPIHLLARGDLSKPGAQIGPGTLSCVPGMSAELAIADAEDESARRAALARWLADGRNALTWRSIVNRVWAYHFGRGICDTPNDFGKMGGTPSHPELLDWLAVWFRDDAKGSLKALHRLILTSATWQQSTFTSHGSASDSDNRFLWRMHRPRLSGEEVRDSALVLGGRLDPAMGGAPAVQFISRGDATFMSGGNPAFLDYEHFDQDAPAARRRAIYRFLFRTAPDPFMDALDCPDGGSITPVRGVSTTAVQAYALLNSPFLIRQCQHIADRIAAQADTAEKQADAAFQLILLRAAREEERAEFAHYLGRHGLANACQWLLNSNEFLYLD